MTDRLDILRRWATTVLVAAMLNPILVALTDLVAALAACQADILCR